MPFVFPLPFISLTQMPNWASRLAIASAKSRLQKSSLLAPELAEHLAWDVEADREAVEHELEDRVLLHRACEVLRLRQRSPISEQQQGSWAADGSQLPPAGSLGGR